jgi:hypothetical protein
MVRTDPHLTPTLSAPKGGEGWGEVGETPSSAREPGGTRA